MRSRFEGYGFRVQGLGRAAGLEGMQGLGFQGL